MQRAEAIANLLLTTPDVWTGHHVAAIHSRDTGFPALNTLLPGHGWPLSSLIELIPLMQGIGELQLLLPVLRPLCREGRDVVFIHPPHIPYPPALAHADLPLNRIIWVDVRSDEEAHWAAEQILREGIAGAVLLWSDNTKDIALRRLQLAAREGESLLFLDRSSALLHSASPATVRIALRPQAGVLHAEVIKSRGGKSASVYLQLYRTA